MADIVHQFVVRAPIHSVFQAISTPEGLAQWWTDRSEGQPQAEAKYRLWFGPDHDWRAVVTRFAPGREFELRVEKADGDWQGTLVGFHLTERDGTTHVRFQHTGWPQPNEHYRISCYCWAMYLRLLKRHVEHGEFVPYADRLEV